MQKLEISTIRRFVLGDLDEETRRSLESEAIENDDIFDEIDSVESEMIDDYLANELPASERRIFEETLDAIPERRGRVELVKALTSRASAASSVPAAAGGGRSRLRYASHARFAMAAGFAAAAITAIAFFQMGRGTADRPPPSQAMGRTATAVAPAPEVATAQTTPISASALDIRRPGKPILGMPVDAAIAGSAVTFLLTAGTSRSASGSALLELSGPVDSVELQVAVHDDEYSHYNAEIRGPDGSTISTLRDLPVTALRGAPVIRFRVPGALFETGPHELVLAGIHEQGSEEVAYIEFDVRKR